MVSANVIMYVISMRTRTLSTHQHSHAYTLVTTLLQMRYNV